MVEFVARDMHLQGLIVRFRSLFEPSQEVVVGTGITLSDDIIAIDVCRMAMPFEEVAVGIGSEVVVGTGITLSDDIIARIGSYGTAKDMCRMAMTNRRFGILMEKKARQMLIAEILGRDENVRVADDYHGLKKRVDMKLASIPNEEDYSWIGLYHELQLSSAARDMILQGLIARFWSISEEVVVGIGSESVVGTGIGITLSDDIIARIGSYGTAKDMCRMAMTNRRFGILMEKKARQMLIAEILGNERNENVREVEGAIDDYHGLKKRVYIKLKSIPDEEDYSWIGLYHELQLIYTCVFCQVTLKNASDAINVMIDMDPETFNDPNNPVTKLTISQCHVPSHIVPVEQIIRAFSTMPNLNKIKINYSSIAADNDELSSSRLRWLIAPESKYSVLKILDLRVFNQNGVESLAAAFETCTSIETLCILPIRIGYHYVNSNEPATWPPSNLDGYCHVETLNPLMRAIANLPRLKRLRLGFEACGNIEPRDRHIEESFGILNRSVRGLVYIREGRHPELRNCSEFVPLW